MITSNRFELFLYLLITSTITLRQTYEKRLAKQREESLRVGQSLDNYKSEILSIRLTNLD